MWAFTEEIHPHNGDSDVAVDFREIDFCECRKVPTGCLESCES
jgi:hypothetical protein